MDNFALEKESWEGRKKYAIPSKNIMLLDLSTIVISVTLLKSRCFCLEKVLHSVERFEVNLEKINKQANLALETTKPFPLADSVSVDCSKKAYFSFHFG